MPAFTAIRRLIGYEKRADGIQPTSIPAPMQECTATEPINETKEKNS
jgi:hypothetical protein